MHYEVGNHEQALQYYHDGHTDILYNGGAIPWTIKRRLLTTITSQCPSVWMCSYGYCTLCTSPFVDNYDDDGGGSSND